MALEPNLLPDTSIFTKPMSIGDLLRAAKEANKLQDDGVVPPVPSAPSPSADAPTRQWGGPPPGTPDAGFGGPPTEQPPVKWSAKAQGPSQFDPLYAAADKQYGLPAGFSRGTGYIESSHNPQAWTQGSQYKGLMQLGTNEASGINVWDPAASIDRAGQIAARNQYSFRQIMGRDPTAGELYLMHQQGAAGGPALLRHPDMPAYKALMTVGVSKDLAIQSIKGNGGNPYAPAKDFTAKWGQHPVWGRSSALEGKTRVASADTGTATDASPTGQTASEASWAPKQQMAAADDKDEVTRALESHDRAPSKAEPAAREQDDVDQALASHDSPKTPRMWEGARPPPPAEEADPNSLHSKMVAKFGVPPAELSQWATEHPAATIIGASALPFAPSLGAGGAATATAAARAIPWLLRTAKYWGPAALGSNAIYQMLTGQSSMKQTAKDITEQVLHGMGR